MLLRIERVKARTPHAHSDTVNIPAALACVHGHGLSYAQCNTSKYTVKKIVFLQQKNYGRSVDRYVRFDISVTYLQHTKPPAGLKMRQLVLGNAFFLKQCHKHV